jgi:hypothetical protein
LHAQVDLVAAVAEFDREQTPPDRDHGSLPGDFLLLVGESEARAFGAWVDAQLYAVDF